MGAPTRCVVVDLQHMSLSASNDMFAVVLGGTSSHADTGRVPHGLI